MTGIRKRRCITKIPAPAIHHAKSSIGGVSKLYRLAGTKWCIGNKARKETRVNTHADRLGICTVTSFIDNEFYIINAGIGIYITRTICDRRICRGGWIAKIPKYIIGPRAAVVELDVESIAGGKAGIGISNSRDTGRNPYQKIFSVGSDQSAVTPCLHTNTNHVIACRRCNAGNDACLSIDCGKIAQWCCSCERTDIINRIIWRRKCINIGCIGCQSAIIRITESIYQRISINISCTEI